MKNTESIFRFIELRAQGNSYRGIAEELGVSKNTLATWGGKPYVQARIRELAAIEADCIREAFGIMMNARVQLLAECQMSAMAELQRRNDKQHSYMTTNGLLKFILKCNDMIEKECEIPVSKEEDTEEELEEATGSENSEASDVQSSPLPGTSLDDYLTVALPPRTSSKKSTHESKEATRVRQAL